MNEFRISKYNIAFRDNGIYTKNEWTSIGDIGKIYDGVVFTYEEYICVENAYLHFIEKVCHKLNIQFLRVMGLEDYHHICRFYNGQRVDVNCILEISRDCLREKYWCRLESDQIFFHFGYDYYLYVGSRLSYNGIKDIADRCRLFVEKKESPYKKNPDIYEYIMEKRFAKLFGINNTNEKLSIALDHTTHRSFTYSWRKIFKYGTDYSKITPKQIWDAAQIIYIDYPDLLEVARKTIFK